VACGMNGVKGRFCFVSVSLAVIPPCVHVLSSFASVPLGVVAMGYLPADSSAADGVFVHCTRVGGAKMAFQTRFRARLSGWFPCNVALSVIEPRQC